MSVSCRLLSVIHSSNLTRNHSTAFAPNFMFTICYSNLTFWLKCPCRCFIAGILCRRRQWVYCLFFSQLTFMLRLIKCAFQYTVHFHHNNHSLCMHRCCFESHQYCYCCYRLQCRIAILLSSPSFFFSFFPFSLESMLLILSAFNPNTI